MKPIKGFVTMLLLVGSLLLAPTAWAAGKSFTDFHQGNFGFDEVSYLVEKEIIVGYENGTFRPDKSVSRAESAVMMQRALNFEVPNPLGSFKDVAKGAYYEEAAAALKEAGIFKGNGLGYFGPDDVLTREQMASVLVRAFDLKATGASVENITDAKDISPSHLQDIQILYQNNVTYGVGNGKYDPKGQVTRAQFSVFMHRLLVEHEEVDPEEPKKPDENKQPEEPKKPEVDQTELTIQNSIVKVNGSTVQGKITESGNGVKVTYDLTNKKGAIESGMITVSKDSTLEMNEFPKPIQDYLGIDTVKQELTKGQNSLTVVEKIDVKLELVRFFFNTITAKGTLKDSDGNQLNVTIEFVL